VDELIALRHDLHRQPELSGNEAATAKRIEQRFAQMGPDQVLRRLGGHGLAFVFDGRDPGPTVLLRCELDALPILELGQSPYRSERTGVGHLCGHDGHMAILASVGRALAANRPARGRVILLFQPAEETGAGAAAVLQDPQFAQIKPDVCFALHNVPGYPLGQLLLRKGTFCCASRGMAVVLEGTTAHAAQPETGTSPARAMCQIISGLAELPKHIRADKEIVLTTVVGARLGEKAFGTAPGRAELWATLRTETDHSMSALIARAEDLVRSAAAADGLRVSISYADVFSATINAEAQVEQVRLAAQNLSLVDMPAPFRWSEDFGRYSAVAPGALFGIGAGERAADLHSPDYDFPDELIEIASKLFLRIIGQSLGTGAAQTVPHDD